MNPPSDTTDGELLAYLQQRDKKRRNNITLAIVVAIPLAIAGFGIHSYVDGKRADERFNNHQVCEFAGFNDC